MAALSLRTDSRTECPGSPGEWCEGAQCCPRTEASGMMTFPCPSYSGDPPANCETQNQPYETSTQPAPTPDDDSGDDDSEDVAALSLRSADVACPGSGAMCSGQQCCPGIPATGGKTFPCPDWNGKDLIDCQTQEKPTEEASTQPAPTPDGDDDSEDVAALSLRSARVACPGSSASCSGQQCCPGIPATGGKTFPCPDWNGKDLIDCQTQEKPTEDASTC